MLIVIITVKGSQVVRAVCGLFFDVFGDRVYYLYITIIKCGKIALYSLYIYILLFICTLFLRLILYYRTCCYFII